MFEADQANPAYRPDCENCGAKLPPPDSQGNRTCQYCEAVYHVPRQGGPQVTVVVGNQTFSPPTVPTYDPAAAQRAVAMAGKTAAASSGVGCFITIIILVVVGAIVAVAVKSGTDGAGFGSVFGQQAFRPDADSVVALPGEPSGPINLAAVASKYEGATNYYVVKADATSGQTLWQSPSLGSSAYSVQLAADGAATYAADKTVVHAYRNTDGTQTWQATLSDEIDTSCRGTCFAVVGSRLITKSRDGQLAAFDTATGAPAWSKRLTQTSAQIVVTGQYVTVLDRLGSDNVVVVLNPLDGTEHGRLAAQCIDTRRGAPRGYAPSSSDTAVPVPFSNAVVFAWDSSPACVQRWDVETGQMAWNTFLDGVSASSAPKEGQLIGPTGVYLSISDKVYDLDGTTGAVRNTYDGGDDLDLAAYHVNDKALLLQGKSTRGTTKSSLVVVNPTTGQQVATIAVGTGEAADGPYKQASSTVSSSEVVFTAALDDTTLRVVQLDGSSKQLRFDLFDATTGAQLGGPKSADPKLGSGSTSFAPVQWRAARLVLALGDGIYVLDTGAGTIASRWPS